MAFEYLTRTPSVAGNRRTFTISQWMKLSISNLNQKFYSTAAGAGTSNRSFYWMIASDYLECGAYYSAGGGWQNYIDTLPLLRDTATWYHLMCAIDTTQATASNRIKVWVNGVLQPVRSSAYPAQNFDYDVNYTTQQWIGSAGGTGSNAQSEYVNANMNDFFLVDGLALDPSYFGKQDSHKNNQWVPKHPTAIIAAINTAGGFGNNGVYLPLNDSSNIGKDASGNNRHWTATNFSTTDVVKDTVHNNFCQLMPSSVETTSPFSTSLGALNVSGGNDMFGTLAFSSGKWYYEVKRTNTTENMHTGWIDATDSIKVSNPWTTQACVAMWRNDGYFAYNANGVGDNNGTLINNGDIVGCAIDHDNKIATFYKNGTLIKTINYSTYAAANFALITPWCRQNNGVTTEYNFGQGQTWVTSNTNAGYADTNGKGKFQYQPPTGFLALCEDNLPDVGVNPKGYFKAIKYSGNSTDNRAITGVGFKPDMLWIKSISGASGGHHWRCFDSGRDPNPSTSPYALPLHINNNAADGSYADDARVSSWDNDGFTLRPYNNYNGTNLSGDNYIAYCFKKLSGFFDIVTYSGDGSATRNISHNLGVTPDFVMTRVRNGTDNGRAWFREGPTPTNQYFPFALPNGYTQGDSQRITGASSTTFSVTGNADPYINASGRNYVAWLFASKPGVCRVGMYTGNASTDGGFIHTGFKPAMVLIKATGSTESWYIHDNASDTNPYANPHATITNLGASNYQISGGYDIDFYSNGFKVRTSHVAWNGSGSTYVYIAIAEQAIDFANAA